VTQAELFAQPKPKPMLVTCRCGHHCEQHADLVRECEYGRETKFGGCTCKKFKPRGRVPKPSSKNFAAPRGSLALVRRDIQKPKPMGWYLLDVGISGARLELYLDGLKTKSLNETNRYFPPGCSKADMHRIIQADMSTRAKQRDRVVHAIEQIGAVVIERTTPIAVTITRVSTGKLDGDNLQGACKSVRDGIAEALNFDDKLFFPVGTIPLEYKQASPGTRGACGVHIEIEWGSA
jgi:hypothetical protein